MESLNLIKNDPWLAPYKEAIEGRYQYVVNKEKNLTGNGRQTLSEMASGYLYFGLHKTKSGWVFREWAPNATAIYLIGTFNEWKKDDRYKLQRLGNGIWEIALAEGFIRSFPVGTTGVFLSLYRAQADFSTEKCPKTGKTSVLSPCGAGQIVV